MTEQHTPGPWTVVTIGDNPPQWNVWADAIEDDDATLCHDIYCVADARLIAAAPAMHELLEAIVYDLHGKARTATVGWMTVTAIQTLLARIAGKQP